MKARLFLALALFWGGCGAPPPEKGEAQADPPPQPATSSTLPSSTLPSPQPMNEPEAAWPKRPQGMFVEVRVEGVLPTLTAVLFQARQVGQIPPFEMGASSMLGSLMGLSDVSALDLSLPAGLLFLEVGEEPFVPVAYMGISSEEAFRKALPSSATVSDPAGNDMAYLPPPFSALPGQLTYLNFMGSYIVASPNPKAFALAKSHLEAVFARKTGAPSVWVAAETGALWKKFGPLASSGLGDAIAGEMAVLSSAGIDAKALVEGLLGVWADIDEVEIRHNPGRDFYTLQVFLTPRPGSAWGTRLAKPGELSEDLTRKLPLGWMGGVLYTDPETLQALARWGESVYPAISASFPGFSRLVSLFTGEMAMSASGGPGASLAFIKVSDEAEARKVIRAAYAAPVRIPFGQIAPAVEYEAIEIEAEEIAGVKVDRLKAKYDLSTASPEQAGIYTMAGLSSMTYRYAYLPGLMVVAAGDDTRESLEKVLKGDPGTFTASSEVTTALEALPKEKRLGAFFFSIPAALNAFSSYLSVPLPFRIPPTKTGIVFGWSAQGDHLRIDLVVPVAHLLELKAVVLGAQKPLTPPSPPAPPLP